MIRIIAAFLFSLVVGVGAVQAQVPGGGPMVPNAAPGLQTNLNAAADPSVNNDATQGYAIGSLWQNANTGRVFIARNVSTGAAVWNALELVDHPGYIANNWYVAAPYQVTSTSASSVANSIRLYPGYVKERLTINNLGGRVIGNAAGNLQLAIYANNPATMRPTGNALASTASMSTAVAGTVSSAASVQLEAGLYWFAANTDTAALTFTCLNTTTSGPMGFLVGSATQANVLGGGSGSLTSLFVAQTFGTWPSLTAASFSENVGANYVVGVEFQVVSIP
jgi:hypothetical protein